MKNLILLLTILYSSIQAQQLNFKLNIDSVHVIQNNKEISSILDSKTIDVNIDKSLNEAEVIINSKRIVKESFELFDIESNNNNFAAVFQNNNRLVELIFSKPTIMKISYFAEGNFNLYKIYYLK